MKFFVMMFLFFLFYQPVFAQQNNDEKKKDFSRIKPGMNEKLIKKLVGEPDFIESFKTVKKFTHDTTLFWRYEKGITIIVKNHLVESVERDYNTILQHIQEWADPQNKDSVRLLFDKK